MLALLETLAEDAHRDRSSPILVNLQVGQGSEQPDVLVSLLAVEGLNWMTFKGPLQPKALCDLNITLHLLRGKESVWYG